MARNWKRVYPSSVIEALRLCKDHALERKRLSVERIAELMGVTADALYKWLSTGRMPVALVPGYEHACGIDLVSRYLATSSGRLVIDMPTGRVAGSGTIHELQQVLNDAVGKLITHYTQEGDPAATLPAILAGLEHLAYHHNNIQRADTPELPLWEGQP